MTVKSELGKKIECIARELNNMKTKLTFDIEKPESIDPYTLGQTVAEYKKILRNLDEYGITLENSANKDFLKKLSKLKEKRCKIIGVEEIIKTDFRNQVYCRFSPEGNIGVSNRNKFLIFEAASGQLHAITTTENKIDTLPGIIRTFHFLDEDHIVSPSDKGIVVHKITLQGLKRVHQMNLLEKKEEMPELAYKPGISPLMHENIGLEKNGEYILLSRYQTEHTAHDWITRIVLLKANSEKLAFEKLFKTEGKYSHSYCNDSISPDGEYLLIHKNFDGYEELHKLTSSLKESEPELTLRGTLGAKFSPCGTYITSGIYEGEGKGFRIYQANRTIENKIQTINQTLTIPKSRGPPQISPDGRHLLAANNGLMQLFKIKYGQQE